MKDKLKTVKPLLAALLFTGILQGQDFLKNFYWQPGVSVNHIFSSELFSTIENDDSYLNKIVYTPTIGFGYFDPKLRMGAELRYYRSVVPSTILDRDYYVSRSAFTIGPYYRAKKWKFSLFYVERDVRHFIGTRFIFPGLKRATVRRNIGLAVARRVGNFDFELTNQQVVSISPWDGSLLFELHDLWAQVNLTISRDIYLLGDQERRKEPMRTDNRFHFSLGVMASGSELRGGFLNDFYGRQGNWFVIEADNSFGLKFTSQIRYAGAAYLLPLTNGKELKIGLHHVWNHTRAQQFLDFLAKPPEEADFTELNPLKPQNMGVGVDLRYGISPQFDFVFNMDVYYKAHQRLGNGLNRESFRLGLLYNLY